MPRKNFVELVDPAKRGAISSRFSIMSKKLRKGLEKMA